MLFNVAPFNCKIITQTRQNTQFSIKSGQNPRSAPGIVLVVMKHHKVIPLIIPCRISVLHSTASSRSGFAQKHSAIVIPSEARFLLGYPSSLCGFSRLFLIYALLYQSFTNYLASPAHFLIRFPCTGYPSVANPPLAFLNSIYPCVSNFAAELKLTSPLSSLLPLSYSF